MSNSSKAARREARRQARLAAAAAAAASAPTDAAAVGGAAAPVDGAAVGVLASATAGNSHPDVNDATPPPSAAVLPPPIEKYPRRLNKNHDKCKMCGLRGKLLLCDGCSLSFHLSCHRPLFDVVPDDVYWRCSYCLAGDGNLPKEEQQMARSNIEDMKKMKKEQGRGKSSGGEVQSTPPVSQEVLEAATALAVTRIMGTSPPESPTAKRTRAGEAGGITQSTNLSSSSGEVAQSNPPVRQEVLEAATGLAIEQIMGKSSESPTAEQTRAGEAGGTTQSISNAMQTDASTNLLSTPGGSSDRSITTCRAGGS